jgi:transposase-like protein
MTVREIRGHLQELYGVEVSPDLISRVTDAVLEEVRDWQNRPLDAVYPVARRAIDPLDQSLFRLALRRAPGQDPRCCAGPSRQWRGVSRRSLVKNKAVYVALAITCEGDKEVLGLWIEQTEGAKFCPRA